VLLKAFHRLLTLIFEEEQPAGVAAVRYLMRHAFADMIADPDYRVADPVWRSALTEAVLQPISAITD
jgi:hypothetical protein